MPIAPRAALHVGRGRKTSVISDHQPLRLRRSDALPRTDVSEAGTGAVQIGWVATIGLGVFALNLFISRYLFWDSYYDLAAGRYVAEHGIPHHEVFTIEGRSRPWIDQQWLAHWLYYEAWRLGGYPLLAVVSSVLVAGGFAALAALMTRFGVHPQRALLWVTVAYVACLGNTVIRAQSFAYPLFLALFWIVLVDSRRQRFAWPVALTLPLLVFWSNVHGTVALAAALVAGYGLWRAGVSARRARLRDACAYTAVAVAAPLTIFANPYGFSVREYCAALISNPVVQHYDLEWRHPSLASPWSWGFFALLAAVLLSLLYSWRRKVRPDPVVFAIAASLLALASQGVRYQAWFALAAAILGARSVAAAGGGPGPLPALVRRAGGAAIAVAVAVSLVVVLLTSDAAFEQLSPEAALAATGAYLERHPAARILADADASSALLWTQPRSIGHVAFDARLEQFPQGRLRRWFEFMAMNTPTWQQLADGYDAIVVTRRTHPGLVDALRRERVWRIAFEDAGGVLFVRRVPTWR